MSTISTLAGGAGDSLERAKRWALQGDKLYIWGCIICGTWVFGPIGSIMVVWGLILMRRADKKAGVLVRPWAITLVGGFILVDTIVNMYAWGLDLFAHDTLIGRSLWIDYGMMVDGGYMLGYNTSIFGGVADPGEKSVMIAMVTMAMPIKLAATWGFLKMKRWGLQWMIISYWMYFLLWMIYLPNIVMDFEMRMGLSEFGAPGFWLLVNLPFLGPLVLLPYLHTIKGNTWET